MTATPAASDEIELQATSVGRSISHRLDPRFQVVGPHGGRFDGPLRDTVIVPPHSPVWWRSISTSSTSGSSTAITSPSGPRA